jgi:hypothetical protein
VTDAGAIDGDQEHSSASEEVYRVPREMGILKVLPCNAEDSCGGMCSWCCLSILCVLYSVVERPRSMVVWCVFYVRATSVIFYHVVKLARGVEDA